MTNLKLVPRQEMRRENLMILNPQAYLRRQTAIWDELMRHKRIQLSWQDWRRKHSHLTGAEQDRQIIAAHQKLGPIHVSLMDMACRRAAEKLSDRKPFEYLVCELGPGDQNFMSGWEPGAVRLGFCPGWVEVSSWVWTELAPKIQAVMNPLFEEFPDLANTVEHRSIHKLLVHNDIQLFLQDNTLSDIAVLSAARAAPQKPKPQFLRSYRGMGKLLSVHSDPLKAKVVVILDAFADYNPDDKKRPSIAEIRKQMELGAGRYVKLEIPVERHKFLDGEKVLSGLLVAAA